MTLPFLAFALFLIPIWRMFVTFLIYQGCRIFHFSIMGVSSSAFLPFASFPGRASCGRKYAFTVSADNQGSSDRERQVSGRNRKYMKFLYKIWLNGGSRPNPVIFNKSLYALKVLKYDLHIQGIAVK
jgi:hypothetical protein